MGSIGIYVYETNEYFSTQKKAAEELGIDPSDLVRLLNGNIDYFGDFLHVSRIPWDGKHCSECGIELNEQNTTKAFFNKHTRKCKFCLVKQNRDRRYKKNGLNENLYQETLMKQNYKCAICGKEIKHDKRFDTDHDHKTGKFRGLLCEKCNGSLGWYENNKVKIERYLHASLSI